MKLIRILEELREPFLKLVAKEALLIAVSNTITGLTTLGVDLLREKFIKSEGCCEEGESGEELSEEEEESYRLFVEWHKETDQSVPLHEYLGMTFEEYVQWILGEDEQEPS
jgi:hypothetical protein